jgi:hypothetical protein
LLYAVHGKVGEVGSWEISYWLQYYAFDVVGEFSFAKRLGFLERGTDVDRMMEAIEGMLVSS